MKVEYPQRFKDLLNKYHGTSPNNYIGQGNPGANILIIGKECTATNNEIGNFYTIETEMNFETWKKNCNKIDFRDISDWEKSSLPFEEKYNPLYPYNSWVFQGKKDNSSKTWDGYQTIINQIFPSQKPVQKGEHYNFWQHCFITELSTYNMDSSVKNINTQTSINERLISRKGILRNDFFQQFPIIILACYHYKDWYNIDIEECFNQKYIGLLFNEKIDNKNEFIQGHLNCEKGELPRLLLHTNHAIRYTGDGLHSEKYYDKIGRLCKKFLEFYNELKIN